MPEVSATVYDVRIRSHRTQEQFAGCIGVPPPTLRSWEQNRRQPSGAARTLIQMISHKPELLDFLEGIKLSEAR